jgi:hypothetical protein
VGRLTVREVVADVVAEASPEELPLLAGLTAMDDAGIDRALTRSGRGREPLGFGLGTAVVLVTPVLWAVLSAIAQEGLEAAVEGAATRVKRRLRRLRRARTAEPLVLPDFEPGQVRRVRELILASCTAAGIEDVQAAPSSRRAPRCSSAWRARSRWASPTAAYRNSRSWARGAAGRPRHWPLMHGVVGPIALGVGFYGVAVMAPLGLALRAGAPTVARVVVAAGHERPARRVSRPRRGWLVVRLIVVPTGFTLP